jgi:dTDP-4-amino-4,6-dideoxy-D-galactose acyltransferase
VSEAGELLAWDSEFFGVPTGRVLGDTLDAARVSEIDDWARGRGVKLLYFRARSDDPATARVAEEAGFRLVDVRMTFEREVVGAPAPLAAGIRAYAAGDLAAVRAIARTAYVDSRFYADGRIPRERCDALYDRWTVQACDGGAARVLVAEEAGRVVGYVTCDLSRDGSGAIGLIGVDEQFRGRGIGRRLVEGAVAWAAERGQARLIVVTQGRNVGAQRLYQRCGFVTLAVELYFHKWYDPPAR